MKTNYYTSKCPTPTTYAELLDVHSFTNTENFPTGSSMINPCGLRPAMTTEYSIKLTNINTTTGASVVIDVEVDKLTWGFDKFSSVANANENNYINIGTSSFLNWMRISPLNYGKKLIGVIKTDLVEGQFILTFSLKSYPKFIDNFSITLEKPGMIGFLGVNFLIYLLMLLILSIFGIFLILKNFRKKN